MFCHTKPNVTQTNFYKLHPKLHPYQHEVDRFLGQASLISIYKFISKFINSVTAEQQSIFI